MPWVDKLLVVFKLAEDIGDVAWHHIKILAHGLVRADLAFRHSVSELEDMLSYAGEEGRGSHDLEL